jgi:hypothetical protein
MCDSESWVYKIPHRREKKKKKKEKKKKKKKKKIEQSIKNLPPGDVGLDEAEHLEGGGVELDKHLQKKRIQILYLKMFVKKKKKKKKQNQKK